jgi:hypothetical protein
VVHRLVTLLNCRIVKQQPDPPTEYNLLENRDLPVEFGERLSRLLDGHPLATSACIDGFSGQRVYRSVVLYSDDTALQACNIGIWNDQNADGETECQ